MTNCCPFRWPWIRVLVLTLYGEYEAEALMAAAEETVKVRLFESIQALVAEATALLEQASAEGADSEVD